MVETFTSAYRSLFHLMPAGMLILDLGLDLKAKFLGLGLGILRP